MDRTSSIRDLRTGPQRKYEGFEISEQARRRYLVGIDREVLNRVQRLARIRGVSTESLLNLLLEQRLHEIEVPTSQP